MNTNTTRIFTIHAGTHKTASTYIQSRLYVNSNHLRRLGTYTGYPGAKAGKFKPLVTALRRNKWDTWTNYLAQIPENCDHVLISAEQFTQPLANPKHFKPLFDVLQKHGFQAQVIVFLRDQPDYMNSRFVHTTRRLYHHTPFEEYVDQQLTQGRRYFDYEYLFRHLLLEPSIQISFLPFLPSLGDPFERLMDHLKLSSDKPWKPFATGVANIQPGHKGVWLAQEISKRLISEYNVKGGKNGPLQNTSAKLRRITDREGWAQDRYNGFNQDLLDKVITHYEDSNDRFANNTWGKSWRDVYPSARAKTLTYELPSSGPEHEKMLSLVEEGVNSLVHKLNLRKIK